MNANEKAVAELALGTAQNQTHYSRKSTPPTKLREALIERANLRESQAKFVLREVVAALKLDDFAAASIFAAASSCAKAGAQRIVAESGVRS